MTEVQQNVQHDDSISDSLAEDSTQSQHSSAENIQSDSIDNFSLISETPVVSLFTGHELQPKNTTATEKTNYYPSWLGIVLLGCITIIAYLRAAYPKRFAGFFRAMADLRFASELVREEKVLSQRISILLTVIFVFSVSTFFYFLTDYFKVDIFSGSGFLLFVKIAAGIILLMFIRLLAAETVGFIFKAENEFSFYSFQIFLFNHALGVFLIPVLIGFIYVSALPKQVFLYLGMAIFLISYSFRLIRGLNIGLARQGFNKFYLFFYFCTLEFLPAVVLARIILDHRA